MKAIDMKPSENFSLRAAAIIRRDNHFFSAKATAMIAITSSAEGLNQTSPQLTQYAENALKRQAADLKLTALYMFRNVFIPLKASLIMK